MEIYLPYMAAVLCSLISGFVSYTVARRQSKEDIKKLERSYELDLEKEKETHKLEIDKLELEHKNELELQQKQFENKLSEDLMNTVIKEAMNTPEVQTQIAKGLSHNTPGKKK